MRVVAVLLILLAGCGSKEIASEAPQEVIVEGVVVDAAIAPVADVRIEVLGQDLVTSSDNVGSFQLPTMPGNHTLRASRAGFEVTDVAWNGLDGLRIKMERVQTDVPFVTVLQWDGFLGCSFYIGTLFGTGCLASDVISDESRRFDLLDDRPRFLQSELGWEHTQPAGENLCLRHYASSGIGGDLAADDQCGASPQLATVEADKIEETGLGNTRGLERIVWVDHWVDGAAGLAVDQQFVIYTHLFFHMQPEAGWTFLADGSP